MTDNLPVIIIGLTIICRLRDCRTTWFQRLSRVFRASLRSCRNWCSIPKERWYSCLHRLIPPARDTTVTVTTSLLRPNLRTKKYCSFINFGVHHYQPSPNPLHTSLPAPVYIYAHCAHCSFRLLFLSTISTAYHLLSGSRAARLLLNWLIDWLIVFGALTTINKSKITVPPSQNINFCSHFELIVLKPLNRWLITFNFVDIFEITSHIKQRLWRGNKRGTPVLETHPRCRCILRKCAELCFPLLTWWCTYVDLRSVQFSSPWRTWCWVQASWRRSIAVRTLVSAGELSISCARLLAGRVTTLWLRRPLSVSQHGQLSELPLPFTFKVTPWMGIGTILEQGRGQRHAHTDEQSV